MPGKLENMVSEAPTMKSYFHRQADALGYVDQLQEAYKAVTTDLYGAELADISEAKRKGMLSTYCSALKEARGIIQSGSSIDDALKGYLDIRDRMLPLHDQAEQLRYVKLHCNALSSVKVLLGKGGSAEGIIDAICIISEAHEKDVEKFYTGKFTEAYFDYAISLLRNVPSEKVEAQKPTMWRAYIRAMDETRELLLGIKGNGAERRLSGAFETKIGMLSGQMKNIAEAPRHDIHRQCWNLLYLQLSRLAWQTVKGLLDSGAERQDVAAAIGKMGNAWK